MRRLVSISVLAAFASLTLALPPVGERTARAQQPPQQLDPDDLPPPPPAYPPPQRYPQGYAPAPPPAPAPGQNQPGYGAYPSQYPAPYPPPRPPAGATAMQLQPPAMQYEERPRKGLLIAGLIVFGGVYINTALWGYAYGSSAGYLFVPVAGPLFYLSSRDDAGTRFVNALCVIDALAQAAGVVMAIAGATTHERVLVQTRYGLHPTVSSTGAGLVAVGSF